jgi:hypothetical protein
MICYKFLIQNTEDNKNKEQQVVYHVIYHNGGNVTTDPFCT